MHLIPAVTSSLISSHIILSDKQAQVHSQETWLAGNIFCLLL